MALLKQAVLITFMSRARFCQHLGLHLHSSSGVLNSYADLLLSQSLSLHPLGVQVQYLPV